MANFDKELKKNTFFHTQLYKYLQKYIYNRQESDVEEEEEVCSDFDLVPDGELLSSEGLLSDDDAEERQNL